MFHALATMVDNKTWQGILDQIPEGRDLVLSHKPDINLVHFSWIVSKEIDLEPLSKVVEKMAASWEEFETQNGGFGIFPGKDPVLTMVLARNKTMCEFHTELWEKSSPFITEVNLNYAPSAWIPHITLMHHDIRCEEYSSFLECCISKEIKLSFKVDNIALIYKDGNDAGVLRRYDLKKRSSANKLAS